MNQGRHSYLLTAAVIVAVVFGVLFFVMNDRNVLEEMIDQVSAERAVLVDGIVLMKGETLQKALEDYTSWEDMVQYVASPTRKWANDNIDSILGTYQANGYWVYTAQGDLVSSLQRSGNIDTIDQPFPGPLPMFDGTAILPRKFYLETAAGVMEAFLASIHRVADTKRSGPVHGYFIFTRPLDQEYLRQLADLTLCSVELAVPSASSGPSAEFINNELVLRRTIRGIDGTLLRLMLFRSTLPEISRLQQHNRLHGLLGIFFILFFAGALVQLARYQRALRRDKKSLDEAQQMAKMGSWDRSIATGRGYWSDNSFRLFGLEPSRTAPTLDELFSLIHRDDRQRVQENLQSAMTAGHAYEVEFRLANDPAQRTFRSSAQVVNDKDGTPVRLVGTIQDISEKLQQEQAKDQLLRQKEMFIARLGHDLKTPLTPLIALLPQIRLKITDEKLARLLDLCLESANLMKALVVKTIKLARFSAPGQALLTDLTVLSLTPLVHDYLRKRADILQEAAMQTEVTIDPTITVLADQLELEEVFYNLISNAVKYSPHGSQLIIGATREGNQVTVCVRDNGSGLTADELTHIFDEFFKADQSRHELDSSGLGLSICKRIVENHGGRIWAESAGKGCGTAIYFTIVAGENND